MSYNSRELAREAYIKMILKSAKLGANLPPWNYLKESEREIFIYAFDAGASWAIGELAKTLK